LFACLLVLFVLDSEYSCCDEKKTIA